VSNRRMTTSSILVAAVVGLIVGLALPAAGRTASQLINGASIKEHSIAGNRLEHNTITGKQVKESSLGIVPRARTLSPLVWHPITPINGWADGHIGTPSYRSPAYAVDAQGLVHFRGTLDGGGSGTVAFTLPKADLPKPGIVVDCPMMASGGKGAVLMFTSKGAAPSPGDASSEDISDLSILDGVTLDPR